MELDSLYQEVILDHYKNPQNKKLNPVFDAQVHHINPSCGDEITLNVTLDGQTVKSVSWDGVGCSISQASVSILTDLLIGKDLTQAQVIADSFMHLMHLMSHHICILLKKKEIDNVLQKFGWRR